MWSKILGLLFKVLELSKTIRQIEVAESYFKKCRRFEISEVLSDLKFKKVETMERDILKKWTFDPPFS